MVFEADKSQYFLPKDLSEGFDEANREVEAASMYEVGSVDRRNGSSFYPDEVPASPASSCLTLRPSRPKIIWIKVESPREIVFWLTEDMEPDAQILKRRIINGVLERWVQKADTASMRQEATANQAQEETQNLWKPIRQPMPAPPIQATCLEDPFFLTTSTSRKPRVPTKKRPLFLKMKLTDMAEEVAEGRASTPYNPTVQLKGHSLPSNCSQAITVESDTAEKLTGVAAVRQNELKETDEGTAFHSEAQVSNQNRTVFTLPQKRSHAISITHPRDIASTRPRSLSEIEADKQKVYMQEAEHAAREADNERTREMEEAMETERLRRKAEVAKEARLEGEEFGRMAAHIRNVHLQHSIGPVLEPNMLSAPPPERVTNSQRDALQRDQQILGPDAVFCHFCPRRFIKAAAMVNHTKVKHQDQIDHYRRLVKEEHRRHQFGGYGGYGFAPQ